MAQRVVRPLWREFSPTSLRDAASHARAGGIAVVRDRWWYLLGDAGPEGEDLPQMVDWAIRAVEAARWWEIEEGVARGLVRASIGAGWRERVGEWIERDRAFKGATSRATFDCVNCAACCYDNEVLLDAGDLVRLARGGPKDLTRRLRTVKGKRYLPLDRKSKACIHLDRSLMCGIYEQRPFMCRDFPAGSEQCMTSREDLYGVPFPAGR